MEKPINKYCPRSGNRVEADSLTAYKGFVVGFCTPGCRDDFQANVTNRPNDTIYFDAVIKELELEKLVKING
ncbi:MAG: YHS domain-containing protein [Pyrinomonadaceae bacterium]